MKNKIDKNTARGEERKIEQVGKKKIIEKKAHE